MRLRAREGTTSRPRALVQNHTFEGSTWVGNAFGGRDLFGSVNTNQKTAIRKYPLEKSTHQKRAELMNRYLDSSQHIPEDRLEVYLLERLPGQQDIQKADSELDAIEGHLQECLACFRWAKEQRASVTLLKRALKALAKAGKATGKTMHASHGN